MALQVCNGAMLMCSMGVAPSTLVVTPEKMVNTSYGRAHAHAVRTGDARALGSWGAHSAAQELSRA
jgi:hypothetical protein